MIKRNLLLLLVLLSVLTACSALMGEEIARLPINGVSSPDSLIMKETSLNLKKGDEIAFWSEMDMAYEGDVGLRFRVEVLKDGEAHGGLEIDPTEKNITAGEVKTSLMGKTNWRFTGRNTSVDIDEDGNYTFKAILVASENPSLVIEKAELVIKK
ncbi:MAG: hypothetical protein AAFX87_22830 [Bacteroidota bacterium]